jgi:hypothetical protein
MYIYIYIHVMLLHVSALQDHVEATLLGVALRSLY